MTFEVIAMTFMFLKKTFIAYVCLENIICVGSIAS